MRNREKQRAYQRKWYSLNKTKQQAWNKNRKTKIRQQIAEYKEGKACIQCGFSDVRAFVFHHRNPEAKTTEISIAYMKGWSWKRTLEEIEKCDLLCANCHAIKHALVNPLASNELKG